MTENNTHPAQRQLSSPNRLARLFHHHSWREAWASPDFPPDETKNERRLRFKEKPWWPNFGGGSHAELFVERYALKDHTWPWGFVIYRTTYSITDGDWAAALDRLDRWCYRREQIKDEPSRIVREGYRNVIIEDPGLEGASTAVIMKRHNEFLKQYSLTPEYGYPRAMYCLMMDARCVQSILLGGEPGSHGPRGYVNVLDMSFDPEDSEDEEVGPFYDGCVRLDLAGGLFNLAYFCEYRALSDLYGYVTGPDCVPYTDGYSRFCSAPRSILLHESEPTTELFCFKPKSWLSRPV